MNETTLKTKVLKALKAIPWVWVQKVNDNFTSGIPDLIICARGRFVAIELKVSKNKATRLQMYVMDLITQAGGHTMVVRTVKEAVDFVREIIEWEAKRD